MKRYLYFLPALAFYSLIFFLSSQSDLGFSLPGGWWDKVPHTLEFAVMGFLLSLGFCRAVTSSAGLSIGLTFLIGTLLGGLDEFHQKFTPGRMSDPRDAVADALGVAFGIAVFWYLLRKRKKQSAA